MKLLKFANDYIKKVLGLNNIFFLCDGYFYLLYISEPYEGIYHWKEIEIEKIKTNKQMLAWIKQMLQDGIEKDDETYYFKNGYSFSKMEEELRKIK